MFNLLFSIPNFSKKLPIEKFHKSMFRWSDNLPRPPGGVRMFWWNKQGDREEEGDPRQYYPCHPTTSYLRFRGIYNIFVNKSAPPPPIFECINNYFKIFISNCELNELINEFQNKWASCDRNLFPNQGSRWRSFL